MHANAPVTAEGRRRLVARVLDEGRPQAHVAAESRLARATVRKWVGRFCAGGEAALADRSSRPRRSPTRLGPAVVARIEALRRDRKLPPRLIVEELAADGTWVSAATVHRWLRRLGISRLRDPDAAGNSHRVVRRIVTERPGQLVHVDVKKIGAIPTGGGWRVQPTGFDPPATASWMPTTISTAASNAAATTSSTTPTRFTGTRPPRPLTRPSCARPAGTTPPAPTTRAAAAAYTERTRGRRTERGPGPPVEPDVWPAGGSHFPGVGAAADPATAVDVPAPPGRPRHCALFVVALLGSAGYNFADRRVLPGVFSVLICGSPLSLFWITWTIGRTVQRRGLDSEAGER